MGLFSSLLPGTASPATPAFASSLLDQVDLGVSVYQLETPGDPESFRLVYSNPASGRITGLDPDAEVGRMLVDVAPGLRELGLLDIYAEVVRSGESADLGRIEYDGARVESGTYQVDAVPLPDQMVGIVFEDVGDREEVVALKSAHKELERQEARYRSLVEATAAIVWTTTPDGELVGEQAGWGAFTGQTLAEYAGAGWLDAIHPDDRDATLAAWRAAVESGGLYAIRHRLRTAAGGYRLMQARGVPVSRDGAVVEWVGLHADIHDQEAAALALAESDTRLRTFFDAVSDVMLVYPMDTNGLGPLRYVNRAAVETYGYAEAELLQMAVSDLLDGDSVDLSASLAELRRTRQATFDSTHRTREGRRIPMRTNARLVELDGEIHVVAVARDDTEGRQFRRELGRANLGLEREVQTRTAQLEAFAEDLKILHTITTAIHATPEARYQAYLEAGCEMFDLPIGILSATPVDPETGEKMYRLEAVVAPDPSLEPGLTVPLSEAFCDAVVAQEQTVVYGDASVETPDHPACIGRGLRAFIGTPVRVDGELVGTLNFVSPEPRPDGFAPYERELIEVMADAIARRLTVDRAAESEDEARELYRSIVETVDEGVIVVDTDCNVILSNPSARTFLGIEGASPSTPEGESDQMVRRWPVVDADGQALHAEHLPEREVLRTGKPVRGAIQGVLRPDGETRWYRVNATPIDRDQDGRPEAVVISFADVSSIQGTSQAVKRARSLLASVLDASPDGVMAFRAIRGDDGTIENFDCLVANPRAAQITGRPVEELVGHRLLEVFPGNREAGLFDAYVRVVETGERFETHLGYAADGLDTSFRIIATPMDAADGFTVTFAEVLPGNVVDFERDSDRDAAA